MAGIAAVLRAVARAQWRDLRTLQSVAGNNLFLFVLLLAYDDPRGAAVFFGMLMGALFLFPLSADPLRTVPGDRLALWPFSGAQRTVLRIASLGLSPMLWILAVVVARTARLRTALELAAIAGAIQAVMLGSAQWSRRLPHWRVTRFVPAFPGAFGGLVSMNIRQMLHTLDFYTACLIAAATAAYRLFSAAPDPDALGIMPLMVALALSTYAQCLFGLDGASGRMRYRLLPVHGWRVLAAKDAAWLLILLPLIILLDVRAGFTGGFVALAVGHHAAVLKPANQQRWRFTSGFLVPAGLIQVIAMLSCGMAAHHAGGAWWLAGSFAALAVSTAVYGYVLDRSPQE